MLDFLQHVDPLYVLSGILVGGLVGMTGVGGGSLMTPILVLLFGMHPATAVGTDLLYASITKASGSVIHGYNRTVDWRVVGRLALGSIPATALAIAALYFNAFVLIVQAFEKLSALNANAPQVGPPFAEPVNTHFAIAQAVALVVFVVLGILAVIRFRPASVRT